MKVSVALTKAIFCLVSALFIVCAWGICFGVQHASANGMGSNFQEPAGIIYKSGTLLADETWTSTNIYVITGNLVVSPGVSLTIQANTIIKFFIATSLDVQGTLNLLGYSGNEVIFTSLRDDSYGGDSNGDGSNTLPAPKDWDGIYLHNSSTTFQRAIVRYGTRGLVIWNDQSIDINPLISHNTFENNYDGISLVTVTNNNINSQIQFNIITHNNYGLYTTGDTGSAFPILINNDFNNNTQLPIYLAGSAFPTYNGNTFIGYPTPSQRLGIGLAGIITTNGTWTNVNSLPYIVLGNVTVNSNSTVTISAGTVIKFDLANNIKIAGTLDLQSTSSSPITFTSFRDDMGGDTNGDGTDLEPLPGDWDGVYVENSSTAIQYIMVKYSTNGLAVWNNTIGDINPPITNSIFDHNFNGVLFHEDSFGDITSLVQDNQITNNQYGLMSTQGSSATGTTRVALISNLFAGNTELPIYLAGSAFPTYSGNTFIGFPTAGQRLGIGLSGYFTQSGVWPIVNNMPYVVLANTTVTSGNIVTLPGGLVVKFGPATQLVVEKLILQSTAASRITFTSLKDDLGGDTNGDGSGSQPAPMDWNSIYLTDSALFEYATIKYGTVGLTVHNLTPNVFNLTISNNSFSFNQTGLSLQSGGSGINQGVLANNTFTSNAGFPILLDGTAYPSYSGNTFANNHFPAIALSGAWLASGTWPAVVGENGQVFPYVVVSASLPGVRIFPGSEVTVPAGTVFKFDSTWMDVLGTLTLQSTALNPIIFTSFSDDSVKGDTNADGTASTPARGNWQAIFLESSTTNFHNAVVKYSDQGVNVTNSTGVTLAPTIQSCHFEQNNFGVYLQTLSFGEVTSPIGNNQFVQNTYGAFLYINSSGDINPTINDNLFDQNLYGLGTYADQYSTGGAFPTLTGNTFSNSPGFPIYFDGTAQPVYSGNTFSHNTHPAIALGGYWNASVTWVKVNGDNNQTFPYVVIQSIIQGMGILSLPEGLVVKFDRDTSLHVFGYLLLQSSAANPITFTSYNDDSVAGDTNADGGSVLPGYSDWKTIWVYDSPFKVNHIHDIIAKYATAAIGVYYDGPANTQIDTEITRSTFSQNTVGVILAIGWMASSGPGAGNIISPITDTIFNNNQYGLVTYAHSNSTGSSNPNLINVQFNNSKVYPIYLGGTSFPIFGSGVSITGSSQKAQTSGADLLSSISGEAPTSLDINLSDTPGIQVLRTDEARAAEAPLTNLQPTDSASCALTNTSVSPQAIGLGGVFNNTGTLCQVDNVPYAVTGNFPITITINNIADPVSPNFIIGKQNPSGSTVTLLPGTILKFGPGLRADVNGKLDLQGTLHKPVIFTSIKDDSAGGDTNRDGSSSVPQKNDWQTISLSSSATTFNNAVVRYAYNGLSIYYDGPINANINPSVTSSIFINNTVGLTLTAPGLGDILSEIYGNLFRNNDIDILGQPNQSVGRMMVNIHDNDLLGSTSYGINNLSTNITLKAKNNYWGDPSGPTHNSNPSGKGVPVSDRVAFIPWRTTPAFTQTYTIQGRVVSNDVIPVGIEGVIVRLDNGKIALTNSGGYFSFNLLLPGNYAVSVFLGGYTFEPSAASVSIPPDSSILTFTGTLTTQPPTPTYTISGQVRDLQNFPVQGVIITLSTGASTVTDSNGNYIFVGVPASTYVIIPASGSYAFTPPSLTVTINAGTGNVTGKNFTLNAYIGVPRLIFLPMIRR